MPVYSFICPSCDAHTDDYRTFDECLNGPECECGAKMERDYMRHRPEARIFTPYYDEGLGCDIHSEGHRKRVMAELGLIESGDRVHGARNFDKHAPHKMTKRPLQGIDRKRSEGEPEEQVVEVVDENGNVVDRARMGDLPNWGDGPTHVNISHERIDPSYRDAEDR